MKNKFKKLLKLFVMCSIHHPEEYYKQGLKSKNKHLNIEDLTHEQICAWKSICKDIEAEFMIDAAFRSKSHTTEFMEKVQGELLDRINAMPPQ